MKLKSRVSKLDSAVWNMHLTIPKSVSDHFIATTGKRIICNIDGQHEFHAALMPKGEGIYFVNINKEIRKKLRLDEGDEVNIRLSPDISKYGIHLPEEMKELLAQDIDGDRVFHKLTIGKQRSLLHIAGTPKSSNIRLRKSLMILDYLKSVNGALDYKELNSFFKEYRDQYE